MTFESVSKDWSVLSGLIDEALALPPPRRAAWLAALPAPHAAHRETLRALLATQAGIETDDFLAELPCLPLAAAPVPGHTAPAAGDLVGPYRLLEAIGQGGMGSVWLAERADGLARRRVALKLPRAVWGDAFTERLVREREILAALEHPHIARLYDAGVDAHGRPFLAMAHVQGQAIDAWCRERAVGVRERVALLLQVMDAVSHAHARLVVHRDLKPGNILVDGQGTAVLLDFGVAKLLDGERTRETALTAVSGRALTPDYASPEQIRGEALGTASDVYGMAVVAYELLSGSRPYRLRRGSAAELEEAIAAVEPPPASASAADPRVARQLRGDLDAILNKALKKAPADRYATMAAFAQDLRHHLAGEPVAAQPDRLAYRAAKFVHRHRLQAAAGTVAVAALLAGASVALWQAREARAAAERARVEAARARVEAATATAVQGFIESVFDANSRDQPDPEKARATTARELLDRGAERIGRELAAAPEAQRRLYDQLARMYVGMALNERGLELQRRSLALATQLYGARSDEALSAASEIGLGLEDLGRHDEALAVLQQADAAARARPRDDDRLRLRIDVGLAHLYFSGDVARGLAHARRAAAIARRLGPSEAGVDALFVLGENARKSGHLAEARQALLDGVAWVETLGMNGVLPDMLSSLGETQEELGQLDEAQATLVRAIALAEKVGDPHTLHISRYKLSRFLYENRLLREALAAAGEDAAWARALGHDQEFGDLPAVVTVNHGRTLVAWGDAARGLATLDAARELLPQKTPDRLGPLLAARADALVGLHRLPEARADLERAAAYTAHSGERVVEAVRAVRRRYLVAAGQADAALQDLAAHPPAGGERDTPVLRVRRQAEEATLLLAAGRPAEARAAATAVLAAVARLPAPRFCGATRAGMTAVLGQALLREGRPAEARPVLEEALALHLAEYDAAHSPATAQVRAALASARQRAGA